MESPDRVTIVLRARLLNESAIGVFMVAEGSPSVYRIVIITEVRTAGVANSARYRLTCSQFARVPDGPKGSAR